MAKMKMDDFERKRQANGSLWGAMQSALDSNSEEGFALAEQALKNGADPDCVIQGAPLLIRCAIKGSVRGAKLALAHGANLHIVDNSGNTALLHAAGWGADEVVALLLAQGADAKQGNGDFHTPLMSAAKNDCAESLRLLLPASDLAAKERWGNTALFLAAYHGSPQCVAELVDACGPAGAKEKNGSGHTPLMGAVSDLTSAEKTMEQSLACAKSLASASDLSAKNNQGETALDLAILEMNWPCAEFLADLSSDEDARRALARAGAEKMPRLSAKIESQDLAQAIGLGEKSRSPGAPSAAETPRRAPKSL